MDVTILLERDYVKKPRFSGRKNKANSPAFGGKPEARNPESQMDSAPSGSSVGSVARKK